MLYDDIEERHVRDFGISADDPSYAGALALFKERLGPDLDEAVRCTRAARGGGELADGDDPKRAALFRDGSRLRELVELHKKIGRHFSVAKELKPKLEAARAALRTFERESRRDASHVLWSLLRPQLPLFGLSCALMTFDSLVGALNYHMTARILDGVADGLQLTDAELRLADHRRSLARPLRLVEALARALVHRSSRAEGVGHLRRGDARLLQANRPKLVLTCPMGTMSLLIISKNRRNFDFGSLGLGCTRAALGDQRFMLNGFSS